MEFPVRICEIEVLMAVTVKITVFSDVTPASLVDICQHLGKTCCLRFQGRTEEYPEDGSSMFFQNVWKVSTRQWDVMPCSLVMQSACWSYFLTLKMEAALSSEMLKFYQTFSVTFQKTIIFIVPSSEFLVNHGMVRPQVVGGG
jgi:hypothetical protein